MVKAKRIPPPLPGVYYDIPFDVYLSWDAVDASLLRDIAHSPAYAYDKIDNPDEDKPVYLKGRLFHLMLSSPDAADREFIIKPDTYIAEPAKAKGKAKGEEKKWNGNAKVCKRWIADKLASGLMPVSKDVHADCKGMAESVRRHPRLKPLVDGAAVEVSVVWMDEATGMICKGRYDLFKNGIIGDPKSSSGTVWKADLDANPFFRDAFSHGYHIQCAMYIDAAKALKLTTEIPWFVFVAVEGYSPYLVMAYDVYDDPDAESYHFLSLGRAEYHILLLEYKNCLKTGVWPGYPTEHEDMMLPYMGRKRLEEHIGWQGGNR